MAVGDRPFRVVKRTGRGVVGTIAGKRVALGNSHLLQELGVDTGPLAARAEALQAEGQTVSRRAFRRGTEDPLTPFGSSRTLTCSMKFRHVIALVVVAALIGLPPVAMASHGCASMGQMCEAPCGAVACAVLPPAVPVAPDLIERIEVHASVHLPASAIALLEPPPKLVLLPA